LIKLQLGELSMTFRKLAASSLTCTALAFACTSSLAQNAVGPAMFTGGATSGAPGMTTSMPATDFGALASDSEGRAILEKITAKWAPLLHDAMEWDQSAYHQFYEGYKNYPVSVLNRALAASTYEAMDAELMAYAASVAQKNADLAFNFASTKVGDLTKDALELRKVAMKALGDDAKDLIFIPTAPCTVWDTRFAGGTPYGPAIGNGVTREFYSHYNGSGTDFSAYGGNPSCSENNVNFLGARPYAAMMIVYVSNATANGWLTFYRDGDPDPSQATISVYYAPGPTRTQTVVAKSSRGYGSGGLDIAVTGRFATADASASVVGYFLKPAATPLDCTTVSNASNFLGLSAASCAAGYTLTGGGCQSDSIHDHTWSAYPSNATTYTCAFYPETSFTLGTITSYARCCRVPGH
jgi:hypothetical protein